MDVEGISNRVRDLLSRNGVSQVELAKSLSIDGTALSKSLSDRRNFTSLDLAQIAEFFGVTVDYLLGVETRTPALAARADFGDGIAGAIDIAEEYAEIREVLNDLKLGYDRTPPDVEANPDGLWYDQGRQMAESALKLVDLTEYVGASALHMARLIESDFCVDVAIENLPGSCDGLAWRGATSALILVATSQNPARQRFTMAHELCHALSSDDQGLSVDANIFDPARKKKASEVRANAFAAAFLMPPQVLRQRAEGRDLSDPSEFASLAMDLEVSPSSLAWTLLNENLITQEAQRALGQMSSRACAQLTGRFDELQRLIASASSPRVPIALLTDCLMAYEAGSASLRLFARVARRPVSEVREALTAVESGEGSSD